MKLSYHRGPEPNFGDELNATMWDALLPPGFLDQDDSELLVGIGSLLNDTHAPTARKIVIGSGFGGYTAAPDLHDGTWHLLWVRGPRTVAHFGLDPALAITDSAIMMAATPLPLARKGVGTAFMPHIDSLQRGDWARVCRLAGITFLDPRAPVGDLLATMRGARLILTEAMHGAIMADTLRVPWIGVRPFLPLHRNKWLDWSESMGIALAPVRARPSSLREAWAERSGLDARGSRSRMLLEGLLAAPFNAAVAQRAAWFLQNLARDGVPVLSRDPAFRAALDRSLTTLDAFVRRRATGGDVTRGLRAV